VALANRLDMLHEDCRQGRVRQRPPCPALPPRPARCHPGPRSQMCCDGARGMRRWNHTLRPSSCSRYSRSWCQVRERILRSREPRSMARTSSSSVRPEGGQGHRGTWLCQNLPLLPPS
jgi:hypothetical protein